ncbi:MAG: hypothetical protein NXI00_09445 [Cytophagales bacterium]|nr:hypothetical protein [Cytophagales bacterium]
MSTNKNMDIRSYRIVLFPLACLLLVIFGFATDAFETDFALSTSWALFTLMIVELGLIVFKKKSQFWNRLKWFILGAILLLTLIG